MQISRMKTCITKHYFSKNRLERRYGLLFLGAPGVGKSMMGEEAARDVAKQLQLEFIKVVMRWSATLKKFVMNYEGEHDITDILSSEGKFFVFTDLRLSTVEPSDLSGPLRSREGIAYYDPLVWAVIHSAHPGIIFIDEITWIQREDVWAVTPQIVLDKIAGFTTFHKDTLIIAAGNRPEDAGSLIRMIHNPLLNRFKIIRIEPPTIDDWAEFMQERYGDAWDKRVYGFLRRFSDEGYLIKMPTTPEGLENFPTPRSWTWIALDLLEGFNSPEDFSGLVGAEVGGKFDAFLKTDIDLDRLIREPQRFKNLNFDARYMAPIMLGSWFTQNIKGDITKAFPLIDAMNAEQGEFLVMACICMAKKTLVTVLKSLFAYNTNYRQILNDIALTIKDQISPT